MAGEDIAGTNVVLGTMPTDVLFGKYLDVNAFGDVINNGRLIFLYTTVSQVDAGRSMVFPLVSSDQDTNEYVLSSPFEDAYNGITPMLGAVITTPDREGIGYTGRKSAGGVATPASENSGGALTNVGSIRNCPVDPNRGVYRYTPRAFTNRANPVMLRSETGYHLLTGEKT
jgi:hypothetical protein